MTAKDYNSLPQNEKLAVSSMLRRLVTKEFEMEPNIMNPIADAIANHQPAIDIAVRLRDEMKKEMDAKFGVGSKSGRGKE